MPRKILVADDDASMLKLYRRIFSETKHLVTTAATVAEASALIAAQDFDLLITDFDLSDGKGTELIRLFSGRRKEAKSFLVTGSSTAGNRPPHEGLAGYFEKPFNISKFIRAVEEVLA